jgi:hypothetical protein
MGVSMGACQGVLRTFPGLSQNVPSTPEPSNQLIPLLFPFWVILSLGSTLFGSLRRQTTPDRVFQTQRSASRSPDNTS